jgi:hypothetical protein
LHKIQERFERKLSATTLSPDKTSQPLRPPLSSSPHTFPDFLLLSRVLLQRISNILTAPPKVTDEDYQKMKRLMSSLDSVDSFTKDLEKKRNKQFFDRVKKTAAYYHHEQWEQEYQRQV